jgi:hypothetical protein
VRHDNLTSLQASLHIGQVTASKTEAQARYQASSDKVQMSGSINQQARANTQLWQCNNRYYATYQTRLYKQHVQTMQINVPPYHQSQCVYARTKDRSGNPCMRQVQRAMLTQQGATDQSTTACCVLWALKHRGCPAEAANQSGALDITCAVTTKPASNRIKTRLSFSRQRTGTSGARQTHWHPVFINASSAQASMQ